MDPTNPPPKSNAGLWAAVIGGVAAVGGVVAAAAMSKKPGLGGGGLHGAARQPRRFVKKPCGCGR